MAEEYDRGFAAAFEYARILIHTCYVPGDDSAKFLNEHLDHCLQAATREAETDPDALRRRLLALWHDKPNPIAEIVNLADVRAMMKGAA